MKKMIKILLSFYLFTVILLPNASLATSTPSSSTSSVSSGSNTKSQNNQKTVKLDNPLVGVYSVTDVLGNVIRVAMSIMGGVVLVMVVKGATTWITANGNSESIESGTKTIIWAIVGALITVASYVVLRAIISGYFAPVV